ncbi:cellulase family glycosylhydrolase [Bifidobacterium animalis]|uniref:cellulase family glycosylhydrolase n=1 Tax=Bifidobacterium animalis TaxID=28025 RepID=UPI001EE90536|nr:cellulase family glycosylhydrolase [Bifidobacterium animalis]
MKKTLAAVVGAMTLAAVLPATAAQAADNSLHVSGGKIYSAGKQFVPQGINHAYQWYPEHTSSIRDIANTGANTVRVVLSGGRYGTTSASEVSTIVNECKSNNLVCILEDHDTTGYGDTAYAADAKSLSDAVQFWKSVGSAVKGQEDHVMINLGNEPYGNNTASQWTQGTKDAIRQMRDAGFKHTLVLTAPNWGQDWQDVMKDNAKSVYSQDSNVLFDVHMYGVYSTADKVKSYIDSFVNQGLPLMVGEFGNKHSDGIPDAATIMSYTKEKGVGMLAWSWCGNTEGVEYLDLVNNWNAGSLSGWGNMFINGANGLKSRGVEKAGIYGGGSNSGDSGNSGNTGGNSGTTDDGYPICSSASVDPDGDGWGWENNQSCQVVSNGSGDSGNSGNTGDSGNSGNTGGNSGTTDDGYPICSSASVDPDGDGWGWENNASCKVVANNNQNSSNTNTGANQPSTSPDGYPYCSSASVDPDGDGWGWENNQSCKVR